MILQSFPLKTLICGSQQHINSNSLKGAGDFLPARKDYGLEITTLRQHPLLQQK